MKMGVAELIAVARTRTVPRTSDGVTGPFQSPKSIESLVTANDGVAIVCRSVVRYPAESRWELVAHVAAPPAASRPSETSPRRQPTTSAMTRQAVQPPRRAVGGGAGGGAAGDSDGVAGIDVVMASPQCPTVTRALADHKSTTG